MGIFTLNPEEVEDPQNGEMEPEDGELEPEEEEVLTAGFDDDETEDGEFGNLDADGEEDDPLIPVQYKTPSGEVVEKQIRYSELGDYIAKAESPEIDPELQGFLQQAGPLVKNYNESEVMQNIMYYKAQGYTDAQIKEGLMKLWGEEVSKDEYYETVDEEIAAKTKAELEKELTPLKKEIETLRYQQTMEKAYAHNNQILEATLDKYGWGDGLNDGQWNTLTQVFGKMFGDKDIRTLMLDEDSAEILIRAAVGVNNGSGKSPAKQLRKAAGAPRVLSGKGGKRVSGKSPRGKEKTEGLTMDERLKRKSKFFE